MAGPIKVPDKIALIAFAFVVLAIFAAFVSKFFSEA